jgi:hypothetical protein
MVQPTDIAWLAGLLEGEGCFDAGLTGANSISVRLSMTDEDIVVRAAALLKSATGVKLRGLTTNGKTVFTTQIYGRHAAEWMMTVYGYMGQRRRARIRECLEQWKAQRQAYGDRTHCEQGHPFFGDNLVIQGHRRVCRICANARKRASRQRHLAARREREQRQRARRTPEQKEAFRLYQQKYRAQRDAVADRLKARTYDAKRRAKRKAHEEPESAE